MLASLHVYPVKGCRAVDLDRAAVEPWGLAGDRRWLIVDADCQFMTQRKHPALARVVITGGEGADITVSSDGYPSLRVAGPRETVPRGEEDLARDRARSKAIGANGTRLSPAWWRT